MERELSGSRVAEMIASAREHCIFPLTPAADIAEAGPIIYTRGDGITLTDIHGRRYLDLMSTHTRANSLGYGNGEVADAVAGQMRQLHYVGTGRNLAPPTIRLAETIAELAPNGLDRLLFVNDGSEAVESAFKLAKQYQRVSGKPRAFKIISRWNAYHGSTMGAIAATDWLGTRHASEPGVPGHSMIPGPTCYRNPFNMSDESYGLLCAEYLEREIQHQGPDLVAAFIAEPVMQANGVQIPPAGYFDRVREICDKYGVLLIIDEVITGFGRTGAWFASEHWQIKPDLLTMAKALTAGYAPMGGVAAQSWIVDALPMFRHIHTFSGHAVAATAANTVIQIMRREGLVERSRDNGAYMLDALQSALGDHPLVGQIRGIGSWLAIDFTADRATKEPLPLPVLSAMVQRMYEHGAIACTIGTAIEIAPPYVTTRAELDRGAEIMARSIHEIARELHLV